jgi:hypothetical protein
MMNRSDFVWQLTAGPLISCYLALLAPAPAEAQDGPNQTFLRKVIQLDDQQLAAVEKGEIVTKQLPTTEKPEVAAFGIVKTTGTVDQLLIAARDVLKFRKSPKVPEMGLFSSPATLADLKGLNYPPDDIAALKKCKPGSCDVKLGTKGLEAVSGIDWKAPEAQAQATAILNQLMVDYVAVYQQGGTEAMATILDKKEAKVRPQEYRALLNHSPYLVDYVKEFNEYLADYPNGKLAEATDVLYWMKDTYGPKPVVSTYHATFYKGPRGGYTANKLIGAAHFFNASLELTAAVPGSDGRSLYLMTLARTRLDPPTGMLAGALMGKVKGGVEQGVKESLKTARDRLAGSPTK